MKNKASAYCYHCLTKIKNQNSEICPNCGQKHSVHYSQSYELPSGTYLNVGRYFVGKCIATGGFGITYTGFDTKLEKKILIKETFYSGIFKRNVLNKDAKEPLKVTYGNDISLEEIMNKTQKECLSLAKAEDIDNIVNVYDWFSENNTVYIITEFINGVTLYENVKKNGYYPWEKFEKKIVPLIYALSDLHERGILHRDIKPQNIMVKQPKYSSYQDEKFVLIDFGLARSNSTRTLASVGQAFSPGYSPMEQRAFIKKDDTYTDVYSLAATIYFSLTGEDPNEEQGETVEENFPKINRLESDYGVPKNVVKALKSALAVNYLDRCKTIPEFLGIIDRKYLEALSLNDTDSLVNLRKTESEKKNQSTVPAENKSANRKASSNRKPKTKSENDNTVLAKPDSAAENRKQQHGSESNCTVLAKPDVSKDNDEESKNGVEYNNITRPHVLVGKSDDSKNKKRIAIAACACVAVVASMIIFFVPKGASGVSAEIPTEEIVSNNQESASSVSSLTEDSETLSDTKTSTEVTLKLKSFLGGSLEDAKKYLDSNGIKYTVTEDYSETMVKDKIMSQEPPVNSELKEGQEVHLVVSKGRKPSTDTTSKTAETSSKKTESKKSENTSSKSAESKTTSSESNKVKVPDIVGKTSTDAMNSLSSLGLYYTGNYAYSDSVPKGNVISQSPEPGTSVNKGSRVTFIISDGPQPEEQPQTYTYTYTYEETPQENTQQNDTVPDTSEGLKYVGNWSAYRPWIHISSDDGVTYYIRAGWSGSAYEGMTWEFTASYNPNNGCLEYSNGRSYYYYTNNSGKTTTELQDTNLSGYFRRYSDSEMYWYDDSVFQNYSSDDFPFSKY